MSQPHEATMGGVIFIVGYENPQMQIWLMPKTEYHTLELPWPHPQTQPWVGLAPNKHNIEITRCPTTLGGEYDPPNIVWLWVGT